MSSGQDLENPHQVSSVITSVTRGRDVLAALAAAWSSSAGQLGMRDTDDSTQPCPRPDSNTSSTTRPRVSR